MENLAVYFVNNVRIFHVLGSTNCVNMVAAENAAERTQRELDSSFFVRMWLMAWANYLVFISFCFDHSLK